MSEPLHEGGLQATIDRRAPAARAISLIGQQARSQHVLPFLALRRKGVSSGKKTLYAETDDFDSSTGIAAYVRVNDHILIQSEDSIGSHRIHIQMWQRAKVPSFTLGVPPSSIPTPMGKARWGLDADYVASCAGRC
jgi:hypothetical protein